MWSLFSCPKLWTWKQFSYDRGTKTSPETWGSVPIKRKFEITLKIKIAQPIAVFPKAFMHELCKDGTMKVS